MPDSNLEDGTSNVGDKDEGGVNAGGEEPNDNPPIQSEEPVTGGGGAGDLTLFYQGKVFAVDSVSRDKVQAVLLMLGYEAPSGNPDVGSDPINQQGTYDFPVQKNRKESFPEEAALGMQRKKGKFVDDGEGSSSVLARTSCMKCGISSKYTMMLSGPDGPETLCNECGLLWDSKSDEEAKESDASNNVDDK